MLENYLPSKWLIGVTALAIAGACRADVYVSGNEGEVPLFASHRADSSFRLLIRDPVAATPAPLGPPRASAPRAFQNRRRVLDPLIERVARVHAVDAALVRAVVEVESRFDSLAISPKGAVGAMQLMPGTAARYGVKDRRDALRNVEAGVAYLKDLLDRFGGNVALALAAYNAGEGAVARHGNRIPRYRETMLYVPQVLNAYSRYRDEAAESGS